MGSPMAKVHDLHQTFDTPNHTLIHPRVTPKPERGNSVPGFCPLRQEVRQGTPISAAQNGLGDYDVVQTT